MTLAQAVRRAAAIVDPEDRDAAVGDFERAFEDADEPVRGIDVQERVATVLADLDPAVASGALGMVGAVTTYLSFRRDALDGEPDELLRLAARAEWQGDPPQVVLDWLSDRGVEI